MQGLLAFQRRNSLYHYRQYSCAALLPRMDRFLERKLSAQSYHIVGTAFIAIPRKRYFNRKHSLNFLGGYFRVLSYYNQRKKRERATGMSNYLPL